jgi:hypothetical protein
VVICHLRGRAAAGETGAGCPGEHGVIFSVRVDPAKGLVVVPAVGACDRAGMLRMFEEARAASHSAGGLPILYDMRGATPGDLVRADIFWLAHSAPTLPDGALPKVRVATVHPPGFAALARFWEDSFRNAGFEARTFGSGDEAVAWLRGEGDASGGPDGP